MSKSIYREALDEVAKRVSNLRATGGTPSFAKECNNYAVELGFVKWGFLAEEFKKEDEKNGICWNCSHIANEQIRTCNVCGRQGHSKSASYTFNYSRKPKKEIKDVAVDIPADVKND